MYSIMSSAFASLVKDLVAAAVMPSIPHKVSMDIFLHLANLVVQFTIPAVYNDRPGLQIRFRSLVS